MHLKKIVQSHIFILNSDKRLFRSERKSYCISAYEALQASLLFSLGSTWLLLMLYLPEVRLALGKAAYQNPH